MFYDTSWSTSRADWKGTSRSSSPRLATSGVTEIREDGLVWIFLCHYIDRTCAVFFGVPQGSVLSPVLLVFHLLLKVLEWCKLLYLLFFFSLLKRSDQGRCSVTTFTFLLTLRISFVNVCFKKIIDSNLWFLETYCTLSKTLFIWNCFLLKEYVAFNVKRRRLARRETC